MRCTLVLLAFSLCPVCSFAQTGFPPFGSFDDKGFDAVNRQNLNGNFAIPIVATHGRGADFGFSIVYDTLIWANGGSGTAWYVVTDPSGVGTWGWKAKSPIGAIFYTHTTTLRWVNCGTSQDPFIVQLQTDRWYNYSYTDPAGTSHPFPVSYTDAQTCSGSDNISGTTTGNATDSSGYFLNIGVDPSFNAPVVYTRSGTQITSTTLEDTNGNFISQVVVSGSETDWKDTANHTALRIVTVSPNVEYHYLDTTGTDRKFTLLYQNYSIKTAFNCTGITDYNLNGTMPQVSLPYELDLPNGQKYSFAYEPTPGSTGFYTGRLTQVTLPTGGTIQYTYPATPNDGINCSDTSGSALNLTRAVSDGTNTSTWTYARTQQFSAWVTTVTDPQMPYDTAANVSQFWFTSSQHDYADYFYQGSATSANLRRTISTSWAANGTPASRSTILEDNSTQNQIQTSFDNNGNILSTTEQDWATSAPGSVLRTTTWTYLNTSPYISANILDRVTRVTVADSTGTTHSRTDIAYDESGYINSGTCHTGVPQHDAGYSCTYSVRGNPTTITTYTNAATPSGSIAHHRFYDNLGNIVQADVDCCQTETWAFSSLTNYSFPDSATRGAGTTQLTTSATYDAYAGLVATSTDENVQKTTYTYDLLNRRINVLRPDGANLSWAYNDALPPAQSSATVTVPIQGTTVAQTTTTTVDGLGRPIQQQVADKAANAYSVIQMQYDPLGRSYKMSNPYTASPQNWTVSQFDVLDRPTKIVLQDNSTKTYTYATTTVTVTDPAGIARKIQSDAIGRATSVFEPDPSNGNSLSFQTTYAYNVLDLPTSVTQGAQSRTYAYDDLGRTASVQTPETNQVAYQYSYNSFGLVTQRTDARGVQTNYLYDTLNRLLGIYYTNVPASVSAMPNVCATTGSPSNNANVCFTYGTASAQNNNGSVITMTDPTGSENYSFDILGRVTRLQKAIGATTYTIGYSYNLASEVTQITYPSNRVVQQSVDAIGRLCEVAPSTTGCGTATSPFATGHGYNAAGQLTGFKYGNGIYASIGFFSDRLLLQCLDYSTTNRNGNCIHDSTTKFGLTYAYGPAGSNNGQISSITDSVDNGRSMTLGYDALYRLTSAVTTGSTNYPKWGLSFAYDRYGNRTSQSVLSGCVAPMTCPTNSLSFANPGGAQTNRPDGMCFDANGNLTAESGTCPPAAPTYTYDAENRLVNYMGSSATYTFDGNSLRVKKASGGTTTVYIFSGSKVIAEYDNGAAAASPSREYIYSGATLLAKIEGGATMYYHPDHLSNRVLTDSSGNVLGQRGHFPFGETWYESGTTTKIKFTTYERDAETAVGASDGNDYAIARNYINRFGRFPSPDPFGGDFGNPQSLNRYAYVLNDPCGLVDPLGLRCTLKIGLGGQILDQQAKDRITDIFKAAGVDIQFVANGPADFNVQQNVALAGPSGTVFGRSSGTTAQINNDAIIEKTVRISGRTPEGFGLALGMVGTIISHEIGHLAIPCKHAPGTPDCASLGGDVGLMRPGAEQGDAAFLDPNIMGPSQSHFTDVQAKAIQDRCNALRKAEKKKNKGGGGGGHEGGGDGTVGGNVFQYTLILGYGWGENGYRTWIIGFYVWGWGGGGGGGSPGCQSGRCPNL